MSNDRFYTASGNSPPSAEQIAAPKNIQITHHHVIQFDIRIRRHLVEAGMDFVNAAQSELDREDRLVQALSLCNAPMCISCLTHMLAFLVTLPDAENAHFDFSNPEELVCDPNLYYDAAALAFETMVIDEEEVGTQVAHFHKASTPAHWRDLFRKYPIAPVENDGAGGAS